jgi:hypothetical protein
MTKLPGMKATPHRAVVVKKSNELVVLPLVHHRFNWTICRVYLSNLKIQNNQQIGK